MDQNASGEDSDNIDWDTEDELEIQNSSVPSSSRLTNPDGEASVGDGEAISGTDLSHSKLIPHFVRMGFPEELVAKAIEENGEGNSESILETLLTYSALENSDLQALENSDLQALENSDLHALENSPQQEQPVDSDHCSSDYYENFMDDLSDSDSWCEDEESTESLSGKGKALSFLKNMGYTMEEASIAMERCGPDASVDELTDFICAAQMARAADPFFPELPEKPKRKLLENGTWKRKKHRGYDNRTMFDDGETLRLPNPMIGYGAPTEACPTPHRILPEAAMGPPYFYYENVALAPKGVWDTIKRFLYDVEPEFVDSKYFCAAARKRGYVHNLPINNRFPLLPLPPRTIKEALPLTRRWWPAWDTRTKLNCLQTCIGSAKLTERLRKALEDSIDDEPPQHVQKYVMDECRKWNLVWVGRNKLAPLECDEVEMLLGFPRNHTRGGGISRTDRYKSLGNSFQVDTVAYHLSVLKDMFPRGINMLSLFSGIGGAEVALHKLGVPLNNVVSVEKSEVNRNIVRGWWEQTNQKGKLIDFEDVTRLDGDRLEHIMNNIGGFDLVIGGSPCNNLAGSNRHHRDGLEGKESSLFYDYFRILDLVKCIMAKPL